MVDKGAGVAALAKCGRCRKQGIECIVYSVAERGAIWGKAPKRCAACLPHNNTCSAVLSNDDDDEEEDDNDNGGACAGCSEKDARIAELEERVAELKSML